jgi:hypothetical protein
VFEIVQAFPADPHCQFEGVSSDRSALRVNWSAGGMASPPVVIVPSTCLGDLSAGNRSFSVSVPPELLRMCPGLGPQLWKLQAAALESVPTTPQPFGWQTYLQAVLVALLLLVSSAVPAARLLWPELPWGAPRAALRRSQAAGAWTKGATLAIARRALEWAGRTARIAQRPLAGARRALAATPGAVRWLASQLLRVKKTAQGRVSLLSATTHLTFSKVGTWLLSRFSRWRDAATTAWMSTLGLLESPAGFRDADARPTRAARVRLAGLIAVLLVCVVLEPRSEHRIQFATGFDWPQGAAHFFLAAVFVALISFFWLLLSGWFGWEFLDMESRLLALPVGVALIVREGFTIHATSDAEINFASGPTASHSVVYPLLQLFFVPLVRDPQTFTMHMNGLLGALATAPLYSFIKRRTGDRIAGLFAGLLLAVDPLVARMAPTDGPASFILFTWFTALAFLTQPRPTQRSIFGGVTLLGIAATGRLDGVFLLLASTLLIDWRLAALAMKRYPRTVALSGALFIALVGIQFRFANLALSTPVGHMFREYQKHGGGSLQKQVSENAADLARVAIRLDMKPVSARVFEVLLVAGAIAGVFRRRYRLGTLILGSILIVSWSHFAQWGLMVAWHRVVPAAALQSAMAGIGAAWLFSARALARRSAPVVLGSLVLTGLMGFENRDLLSHATLLNEEYDILRRNLGAASKAPCTLLTSGVPTTDLDFHDINGAIPALQVSKCWNTDCIDAVSRGGCFYYLRSINSLRWENNEPVCSRRDVSAARYRDQCLVPESAFLETALDLEPIDVRTVPHRFFEPVELRPLSDVLRNVLWPDDRVVRPRPVPTVEIGLFRVKASKGSFP